jgi:hypothetical protein
MGSAPGCPALQGMVLRPHPWPSLHSAGMPLAQPCPAFIAVASRFVAHASSARSYLRICPRQAVPVRCRPTVWWLCCSCGRCIEFDVCYYLFYPRGVPPRLSRRGHASPPVMSFVLCTAGLVVYYRSVGQGGVSHYGTWKARNRDPWIQASQEFFSTLLAGGWRHLAPSCSVHGQGGPLPRRATVSPAPLSPHATRSESMAPQILRLGPPSSDPKIRLAGASGKGPAHKIGY